MEPAARHQQPAQALATLPGSRASCALLTILTILLVWPTSTPTLRVLVLPLYFALLASFFWTAGRGRDALQDQAMRLVRWGFLLLWFGFTVGAVIHFGEFDLHSVMFAYLREACEQGALFLLGVTLIAYGLMLWIPRVIQANEVLSHHLDQQASELVVAHNAKSELEHQLIEADRRGILGELAGCIAHDLRNPLAIVVGAAESLCRRQRSASQIMEHTDVIRRNISRACNTLDSLIDLGRPRAQQFVTIDAGEVADEVIGLVHTEARRQGTQLMVRCDENATVYADRNLISQALLNLVLNAVHATTDKSAVVVRLRTIGRPGQQHTVIAIEDRGCGVRIPARMGDFAPFRTSKPDGTGLGLWSCRRIAEEHGGSLALYPRHRGGARAMLSLPATPPRDIHQTGDTNAVEEESCPTTVS